MTEALLGYRLTSCSLQGSLLWSSNLFFVNCELTWFSCVSHIFIYILFIWAQFHVIYISVTQILYCNFRHNYRNGTIPGILWILIWDCHYVKFLFMTQKSFWWYSNKLAWPFNKSDKSHNLIAVIRIWTTDPNLSMILFSWNLYLLTKLIHSNTAASTLGIIAINWHWVFWVVKDRRFHSCKMEERSLAEFGLKN